MILITGASGLIGSELVKRVLKTGKSVVGLDKFPSGVNHANYQHFTESFDSDTAFGLAKTAETIVHLAGASSSGHFKQSGNDVFWKEIETNVRFFSFLSKNCQSKIIFASTEWVYGEREGVNPISEESGNVSEISDFYALTKSMLENIILHNHALKNRTMVARFGIVLSSKREHLTLIEYVCKKFSTNDKSLKIKSKKIGRAYILLYDLVEMLEMSIFEHHSGIYNLGGAEFFSVEDVRCLSEKLLGRRLTLYEEDPGLVNYRNMNSKKFFEKYKYRPRGSESIVKVLINDFGGKIVE